MPRVVIVLRSFEMGGAQRQAALIANGLRERAAAAVEVLAFEPGSVADGLLADDVPRRIVHPGSAGTAARRARDLWRFVLALRGARPDVLLPFTDFPNRVCGAIWPLTGAVACIWNQRDEGREVTRRPLECLALNLSSHFVANSAVGKQHLVRTFAVPADRITVIPNGVSRPGHMPARDAARRALGVEATTPVATMIANLHRYKDHETLLRAWRQVVDTMPTRPVLLLAGRPGDMHERVVELIAKLEIGASVRLLGEVDGVWDLLAASDVAVFSSRREGCPNAVLEAMAAARPVVATGIVGTREALGETYPALVPEGDAEALARATRELLADRHRGAELGARNRRRADEHFTVEAVVAAYARLVSAALRGGRYPTAWR